MRNYVLVYFGGDLILIEHTNFEFQEYKYFVRSMSMSMFALVREP